MEIEKLIKRHSLKNFSIINKLKSINTENIPTEEKEILEKIINEIIKNDKEMLKDFEVKFSDKTKKEMAEMISYIK